MVGFVRGRKSMKPIFAAGLAATAAAFVLCVQPAAASPLPDGGMTAPEVATWLQNAGYQAVIKDDPTTPGDSIISSSIDGVNYDIYMYACKAGRCQSLQYAAGWTAPAGATTDKINEWDRDKRYVRAYLDKKGNAWGEYDVDINPGGSYEQLNQSLTRWRSAIGEFKTFIGG
jgi:hypothetical protein